MKLFDKGSLTHKRTSILVFSGTLPLHALEPWPLCPQQIYALLLVVEGQRAFRHAVTFFRTT